MRQKKMNIKIYLRYIQSLSKMSIFTLINVDFNVHYSYTHIRHNIHSLIKLDEKIMFTQKNITILFEGSLFNSKYLYKLINYKESIEPEQHILLTDHQLIIQFYMKYGIEYLMKILDGAFSFILIDSCYDGNDSHMYVCQDQFGERQMYIRNQVYNTAKTQELPSYQPKVGKTGAYAVIPNVIIFSNNLSDKYDGFEPLENGTYNHYCMSYKVQSSWKLHDTYKYYTLPISILSSVNIEEILTNIKKYMINSVKKRCSSIYKKKCMISLVEERCTSIDNKNIISTITKQYIINNLVCLYYENNNEYKFSEEQTIQKNEIVKPKTPYFIRDDDIDVIFGNACSHINDPIEYDKETRRLMNNFHISREIPTTENPNNNLYLFLDRDLIQYYLSIPLIIRFNKRHNNQLFFDAFFI